MQACTHTGCSRSACHNSVVQTGFGAVPRSSLGSFFLVAFSQLFDSFRKRPECWADSPYTKWSTVVARRVGVPVLSAAFTLSWDSTLEGSCLVPAEMDLWKLPAPPLTCFYFSTPCKGKKFLIQLIPPPPRNSTDPLTPPPLSFKKSQPQISARVSVFHRGIWLLVCIVSNKGEVREDAKYKQHICSPGSVLQSLWLLCQQPRADKKHSSQRRRKTPVFTEQPHFMSRQMLCWGLLCCWLWIGFDTRNSAEVGCLDPSLEWVHMVSTEGIWKSRGKTECVALIPSYMGTQHRHFMKTGS